MSALQSIHPQRILRLKKAVLISLYTLYIYVLLEWLFFATKPSFLTSYSFKESVFSLLSTPLILLPGILFAFLITAVLFLISANFFNQRQIHILAVVPATISTTLTVLLIDNFLYTVLQIGISTTKDYQPYFVLFGIIIIWLWWCFWFSRRINANNGSYWWTGFALLGSSFICLIAITIFTENVDAQAGIKTTVEQRPNIIFFATDGIQANHVSAYGYYRNNTPNLDEFSKNSLLVYNTVPNAGRTTGSITSMLTGKYATTNKVVFPPHVLSGRHVIEHLPGILKKLGYLNVQESVRYYADGQDLNMYGAFDFANGRSIEHHSSWISEELDYKLFSTFVLSKKLLDRISERLLHLTGKKPMSNVFDAVNPEKIAKVYGISDRTRVDRAMEFVINSNDPVFAHIHLMETHCCSHRPDSKRYSNMHARQNNHNFVDFYDDSIVDSDVLFGRMINQLERIGELENSIVIYSSDHTRGWRTNKSVPLIIRFPNGEHAGQRGGINQLIDVAPTIIEYLGLPPIEWMEGESLLSRTASERKYVFTVDSVSKKPIKTPTDRLSRLVGGGPPNYGVVSATLVNCNQNFRLNIIEGNYDLNEYKIHGESCSQPLDIKVAINLIEQHLLDRGFGLAYKE